MTEPNETSSTYESPSLTRLRRDLAERQVTMPRARPTSAPAEDPLDPDKLRPATWTYGDTATFRAGLYTRLPDITGKRQLEGGWRLSGRPRSGTGPLVSIVTAVWNNPDTLQRCIDSVRAQTWGNIEHIIIDGCSDEPTLKIIRANADHLAYFVSEPDAGIYSAMNKGIAVAKGDYICLLNSDDVYDPDFVSKTLKVTEENPQALIHTDYFAGETHLQAMPINAGILFGHLHICHNTFLTPNSVYDRIGPYDESYRIVSDAIWMRRAWAVGVPFKTFSAPLFTLSEGGLSSGSNEAHRKLFIEEVVRSYQVVFPMLDKKEAEDIYLFRFNKARTSSLYDIALRHRGSQHLLAALKLYVEHCFRDRKNFRLSRSEVSEFFPDYVRLSNVLKVDRKCFNVETKSGYLFEVLSGIDRVLAGRKAKARKTVLHFITVFSAPSETFVYDLLTRLEAEEDLDNFVLYEHAKLMSERPYSKAIQIPWADFDASVAGEIYHYILACLNPDLVISHFALNEWKWAQRTKNLGIEIPTISMCHGIDVFSLRDKADYRHHVVDYFSKRSGTAFTAVSNYLRDNLVSSGVPESRVHLLHNVVNDRFFQHRKSSDFYNGKRDLRLLCIGRLVRWKGHHFLLEALARFRKAATRKVTLTIVYGNGADRLQALQAQAQDLGISDCVTFEPFVDFNETPDYLSGFDLYIHPSTYSEDALNRSESFGVSVLEAITAGLPVISSDAGGLPEVIGDETRFARIVPHGNSDALAEALVQMWRDKTAFADNRAYAEDRLARFSAKAQMTRLRDLIDVVSAPRIKAAIFSSSTVQGAGYAAFRVHRGLRETRIAPHMFTTVKNHQSEPDVTVIEHPSGDNAQWRRLQLTPPPGMTIFTINDDHIPTHDLLRLIEPYDVISLHWHARFMSLDNIAALTKSGKPVVMTIRDMMPLTGGCHFFHGCTEWRHDCQRCPQMPEALAGYPSSVVAMKRSNYDFSNLTLVTISNHTREILAEVPVFSKCRVETIPNSIELDVFRPFDRDEMRLAFGIPPDRKVIGYVPSFSSEVKGYKEIVQAMKLLDPVAIGGEPFVMLIGPPTPATDTIPFEKKSLGYINDNHRLARAYSCADVIVVPSLEETFSNTTAESIACGVPVVGFRTGAIPDLAVAGISGVTCEVGDVTAMAQGIAGVLTGASLRGSSRAHAESMLSFMTQAKRYETLFEDLLGTKAQSVAQVLSREAKMS